MPPRYALTMVFPVLAALGVIFGGWWTLALPLTAFGALPLAELVLKPQTANLTAAQEEAVLGSRWFDGTVYAVLVAHVVVLALFVTRAADGSLAGLDLAGATLSVGICCGALGINLGHELGHRRDPVAQRIAKLALGTSWYGHFFVEHNRGHHVRVATADDPATSRRGEVVYTFWFRSVVGGLRSAWALEADRLRKRGQPVWSWHNETLRLLVGQAIAIAAVGALLGPMAVAAWGAAALVGILLLETVNYVEHYGLVRAPRANGRPGAVRPEHSWNSDHALGRVVLFELSRHADHHASPHRPFPILRHIPDGPQLPTGYPGMVLLALAPPLFLRVMDRQLDRWQAAA